MLTHRLRKTMLHLLRPVLKRGQGGGGNKYDKLYVTDELGEQIGYMLVNEHSKSLDAHCLMHDVTCSMGRSYVAYEGQGRLTPLRASKGRPLAFCIAWLRCHHEFAAGPEGRADHFNLSKGNGALAATLRDGTSDLRRNARIYAEETPSLAPAREKERRKRADEPLEPPGPF